MDAVDAAQALSEIGYLLRLDANERFRAQAFSSAAWAIVLARPNLEKLRKADELTTILDIWKQLVPKPAFDFTYTFGVQCSSTCPAPQALSNHPELQPLMQTHNR